MATQAPGQKKHRFTRRKNGREMTTIPFDLHIDGDLADFVAAELDCSRSEAVERIAKSFDSWAFHALSWRAPKIEAAFTGPTGGSYERDLVLAASDDIPKKTEQAGSVETDEDGNKWFRPEDQDPLVFRRKA